MSEEDVNVLFLILISGALYFLPAIVAHIREHHNLGAIFTLNLLLGWTLLGWVAAIVWAMTTIRQQQTFAA